MFFFNRSSVFLFLLFLGGSSFASDFQKLLTDYQGFFEKGQFEQGLELEQDILNEGKLASDSELAEFYASSAKLHFKLRDYASSSVRYEEAIRLYSSTSDFKALLNVYEDYGISQMRLGQYQNSIELFNSGFLIASEKRMPEFELIFAWRLAKTQSILELYPETKDNFSISLGLLDSYALDYQKARITSDYAEFLYEQGELDSALVYARNAVEFSKAANEIPHNRMLDHLTVANVEHALGYDSLAAESYLQALMMARTANNNTSIVIALLDFADAESDNEHWAEALEMCNDLMSMKQVQSMLHVKHEVLRMRAKAYRGLKDYDKALEDYLAADVIEKQVLSEWNEEDLAGAEMMKNYNSELKAAEIRNLQSQAERDTALSTARTLERNWVMGLCFLLFLLALLLLRMNSQKSTLVAQERELFEKRLREFSREKEILKLNSLIEGQEMERSRIGKDLHDRIGGILSAVKLQIDVLSNESRSTEEQRTQKKRVLSMIDRAVEEVRMMSNDLISTEIEHNGLGNSIIKLCNSISNSPLKVFSDINVDQSIDLPPTFGNQVYRIVKELIANCVRHSKASEMHLSLTISKEKIEISAIDNGLGSDLNSNQYGLGLYTMQERIGEMKGQVELNSTPGQGFEVQIDIPINGQLEELPV